MNLAGLQAHSIELRAPLLILGGRKGLPACGHLEVEKFSKTGDRAADPVR
jgi:uncharacterized protein YunC (DUF1805 family)